ncbi:protein of unknown function [Streptomyces murinus]
MPDASATLADKFFQINEKFSDRTAAQGF